MISKNERRIDKNISEEKLPHLIEKPMEVITTDAMLEIKIDSKSKALGKSWRMISNKTNPRVVENTTNNKVLLLFKLCPCLQKSPTQDFQCCWHQEKILTFSEKAWPLQFFQ